MQQLVLLSKRPECLPSSRWETVNPWDHHWLYTKDRNFIIFSHFWRFAFLKLLVTYSQWTSISIERWRWWRNTFVFVVVPVININLQKHENIIKRLYLVYNELCSQVYSFPSVCWKMAGLDPKPGRFDTSTNCWIHQARIIWKIHSPGRCL